MIISPSSSIFALISSPSADFPFSFAPDAVFSAFIVPSPSSSLSSKPPDMPFTFPFFSTQASCSPLRRSIPSAAAISPRLFKKNTPLAPTFISLAVIRCVSRYGFSSIYAVLSPSSYDVTVPSAALSDIKMILTAPPSAHA